MDHSYIQNPYKELDGIDLAIVDPRCISEISFRITLFSFDSNRIFGEVFPHYLYPIICIVPLLSRCISTCMDYGMLIRIR